MRFFPILVGIKKEFGHFMLIREGANHVFLLKHTLSATVTGGTNEETWMLACSLIY